MEIFSTVWDMFWSKNSYLATFWERNRKTRRHPGVPHAVTHCVTTSFEGLPSGKFPALVMVECHTQVTIVRVHGDFTDKDIELVEIGLHG